jgi:hypothetical protein
MLRKYRFDEIPVNSLIAGRSDSCYKRIMPDPDHSPENKPEGPACPHDFQLETVGGAYLTGAYVCRLCSHRVGMSDSEFRERSTYPRHYQEPDGQGEPKMTKDESSLSQVSRSDPD